MDQYVEFLLFKKLSSDLGVFAEESPEQVLKILIDLQAEETLIRNMLEIIRRQGKSIEEIQPKIEQYFAKASLLHGILGEADFILSCGKNGLIVKMAQYLLEKNSIELWKTALSGEQSASLVTTLTKSNILCYFDEDKMETLIKAMIQAEVPHSLIEVLGVVLVDQAFPFRTNK